MVVFDGVASSCSRSDEMALVCNLSDVFLLDGVHAWCIDLLRARSTMHVPEAVMFHDAQCTCASYQFSPVFRELTGRTNTHRRMLLVRFSLFF